MDLSLFTSGRLGSVRRTLEGYYAYYPEPVPRQLNYEAETVKRLTTATAALHRLAGASRLLPSPDLLMGPYIRLEAVLSSKIEGTQTRVDELLLYEANGGEDSVGDVLEVFNYMRALRAALNRLGELPLSLRLIREAHAILMEGVRGESQTPGEFRRSQNWIGPPGSTLMNARYVPPPPDVMNDALADLERFLHEYELPTLVSLALAHYQFEAIHPFLDGNGRIGRLLVPLVLCERGDLPHPMLYLSAFFESRRQDYYDLLFSTSATGDLGPWLNFFLEGVETQAKDAEDRTVRLVDLQSSLRDRLMKDRYSVNTLKLAEQLLDRPYITAMQAESSLDVTRPTAQQAIDNLVEVGVLREVTGRRRGRVYCAPEVLKIVYDHDVDDQL